MGDGAAAGEGQINDCCGARQGGRDRFGQNIHRTRQLRQNRGLTALVYGCAVGVCRPQQLGFPINIAGCAHEGAGQGQVVLTFGHASLLKCLACAPIHHQLQRSVGGIVHPNADRVGGAGFQTGGQGIGTGKHHGAGCGGHRGGGGGGVLFVGIRVGGAYGGRFGADL